MRPAVSTCRHSLRTHLKCLIDVDALLMALSRHDLPITFDELATVVETNSKRRFAFNADRRRIRVSQGHSVAVDLGSWLPSYGSTAAFVSRDDRAIFLPAIRTEGLLSGRRKHVHLSLGRPTAAQVIRDVDERLCSLSMRAPYIGTGEYSMFQIMVCGCRKRCLPNTLPDGSRFGSGRDQHTKVRKPYQPDASKAVISQRCL